MLVAWLATSSLVSSGVVVCSLSLFPPLSPHYCKRCKAIAPAHLLEPPAGLPCGPDTMQHLLCFLIFLSWQSLSSVGGCTPLPGPCSSLFMTCCLLSPLLPSSARLMSFTCASLDCLHLPFHTGSVGLVCSAHWRSFLEHFHLSLLVVLHLAHVLVLVW